LGRGSRPRHSDERFLIVDSIKKLLILDIDETLIYATEASLPRQADFLVGNITFTNDRFLMSF
jgi:hypothetical protein